jgi:hypothetical protein
MELLDWILNDRRELNFAIIQPSVIAIAFALNILHPCVVPCLVRGSKATNDDICQRSGRPICMSWGLLARCLVASFLDLSLRKTGLRCDISAWFLLAPVQKQVH